VGALSPFTVEQWGMVTAAQARAAGVSRVDVARLAGDGVLEPVAARVYRLAGAPPDPDRDGVRAVWLQMGDERVGSSRLRAPDAVVAGRSAALLLGVGDLAARVHNFYVTRRRQLRRADVRLRVRARLPRGDWQVVEGLPVCTAARVVADLLSDREDASAVARACLDAVAAGILDPADLTALVAPHARAYGATSAQTLAAHLLGEGPGRDTRRVG